MTGLLLPRTLLRSEADNPKDKSAVAVIKEGEIVGHISYNKSNTLSQFLGRDSNRAFAEVTGCYANRGAGHGLEVPCFYRFYGPEPYIRILQELLSSFRADGLI